MAAEVIPDPGFGEAWGFTLHPSQLSGPKSVQRTGMLESRNCQLGSQLATGFLPGNNFPFNASNLQRLFQISSCSNFASSLTRDTSVCLFLLKMLLFEAFSLCQSWLGVWTLAGPVFPTLLFPFLIYLFKRHLSASSVSGTVLSSRVREYK